MAEDNDKSRREMESFLEANPIPPTDDMNGFMKLLDDPNAAWKEIDGKGGAR